MNTRFTPIEIQAVDPKVAQLQARAQSYINQIDPTSWWKAPDPTPQFTPSLSGELGSWQGGQSSPDQAAATAQAGPPRGVTSSDRDLLAKTLAAEAGGEGYEGMLAAGAVIANRANKGGWWGDSVRDVILKPGQFSAWNGVTGYAGGKGGLDMDNIRVSDAAWQAADAILSGNYRSPVGNRTHYYNPSVADPAWGKRAGGDGWMTIGNHVFGWGS